MTLRHPEALPMDRRCCDCGRTLPLNSDNFTLSKAKGRYPWQPSAYAKRCKPCQSLHLKALRQRTKAARAVKDAQRMRETRAAIAADPLYFAENMRNVGRVKLTARIAASIKADKAAAKAKAAEVASKAAHRAEVLRILRAGRRYDPAKDPIKQMIRADVERRRAKRAGRPAPLDEPEPLDAEQRDYLRQLEALRDRHRREAGES